MRGLESYLGLFAEWLRGPLGRRVLHLESERMHEILRLHFGYEALVLGEADFMEVLRGSPIKWRTLVHADSERVEQRPGGVVCARHDCVPISGEYTDLVYLAHCLEFANYPHEVLRESYRVLRPDGCLVISMFNPMGLWGIWRLFARWFGKIPWRANFLPISKLRDWLALLGFDIIRVYYFDYGLPLQRTEAIKAKLSLWERFWQRLNFPYSGMYIVEASKRVVPITPIRPRWQDRVEVAVEDISGSPV